MLLECETNLFYDNYYFYKCYICLLFCFVDHILWQIPRHNFETVVFVTWPFISWVFCVYGCDGFSLFVLYFSLVIQILNNSKAIPSYNLKVISLSVQVVVWICRTKKSNHVFQSLYNGCGGFTLYGVFAMWLFSIIEVPLSLELPLKLKRLITSNVRPNPEKLGECVANCTLKSWTPNNYLKLLSNLWYKFL